MEPMAVSENDGTSRRDFIGLTVRGLGVVAFGGAIGKLLASQAAHGDTVWQLDPAKCTQCGKCATNCVMNPSAVKCFHAFDICGYCDLCTGYFEAAPNALTTAAENQQCPTAAIVRSFVEDPYFEFRIDRNLCIGCAKCVKGCGAYGNGSLYLQIDHKVCKNCNWCSIAAACPAEALRRVPAAEAYIANKIRTAGT